LQNKTLAIGAITAKNADFKAWLNPNGELNYQTLLPEDEAQVDSEKEAGESMSEAFWGVKIDSVELTDFSAVFEDKTLSKPVTINVSPLSLKLTELSNAVGAKLPFELSTKINDSGSLHLKGSAGLSPLTAQTQIDVNAVGLEKFQSYVDKFAHLDLIKGVFSLDGKLDVARGEQGELDVKFKGNSGIARLITRDQTLNKDLLKWDNLTLKNIDADVLAQRYSASALQIEKPYARVVIGKNKTLNFADIFIATPESKDKKLNKSEKNSSSDIHFKLDKVKISNGASSFADLSMILPFSAEIRGLDGGASGISSEHESTINVTLKGNAYDLAPVDIKGKIQPFVGDYKAALNFKGMPLPLMSAYMAEFAGYKLENGKMSIGMNYEVEKGELSATNNLHIEQFELGEKVDNPHAIDAPIDLAIALLKDMDGIINLDVPITGSLNDPHFDFGGIVGDALLNIISKTITSPFQAIASLLGTNEDLSAVQFSPGDGQLSEWQKPKLNNLAKVLREREILKVQIRGTAFESDDWAELSEIALTDRLKTLKSEELERKHNKKILPEYIELDDTDAQRLLAQEFAAKYPHLVKKSFFGNFELVNPEMGEFYTVAKQTLSQAFPIEQKRLTKLAATRARAVAKYLVQEGGVPNERVFILDVAVNPPRTDTDIDTLLFLKVD
jgi:outer membrane protein OmpA-like peptidoglycan-associated protein